MVDAALLEILACPRCVGPTGPATAARARGELELVGPAAQPAALRCKGCGRVFPIQEGIPDFLNEDAEPTSAEGAP